MDQSAKVVRIVDMAKTHIKKGLPKGMPKRKKNNIMQALLKLLSPLSKLNMLKTEVERQLNIKIKDFELIYHKKLSCLKFKILDVNLKEHVIDYEDSKNLESLIKMYLDTQNNTDNKIEGFTVGIVNEKTKIIMYLSDNTKQIL